MTNGLADTSLQQHGPKVYGIVQRTGSDRQQEVMAREWTVNHLQDEMRYIREVSANGTRTWLRCVDPTRKRAFLCPNAGERLSGEGEGADVWAVWRDAANHAESLAGNKGNAPEHQSPDLNCHLVELLMTAVFPQTANSHRRSLESEVKIRTEALKSFDQMNSSLITANLDLQVRRQGHGAP